MPPLQLIALALASMSGLVALRILRVNLGRTPLPEERGRRLFLLAFVTVPPILLGAATAPAGPGSALRGLLSLPVYVALLAVLVTMMWLAAQVVARVAHRKWGRLIRLALIGGAVAPNETETNPPVTAPLADGVAGVQRANAEFPRGPEFPAQVARAGFRHDWETLDEATRRLEDAIASDLRSGLSVASAARSTVADARSRLETLRGLAVDGGQLWAAT
jgi:hypothetical protein